MSRPFLASLTVVVCVAATPVAGAQPPTDDFSTPAHVSAVRGRATVERDGRAEAATENLPLLVADRVRTEAGCLEVLLPDGSALALDSDTTVDLLSGGLMRLLGGRMLLAVSRPVDGDPRRDYQVDTRAGIVRFLTAGEYRIAVVGTAEAPGVDVAVVRGQAVLDAEGSSIGLSAGERATAVEGQGISSPRAFNSAQADAFCAWADQLRSDRVGGQSNAYLPSDLQVYGGTFDRDGSWDSLPDYGYVWYPRVAADWHPYYDGAWQSVRLGMDVGWRRTMGLADASLWPLGSRRERLVLDADAGVGPRLGFVGNRGRLRRMVSAWLERRSGVGVVGRLLDRLALGSLAGMDRSAAARVRARRPRAILRLAWRTPEIGGAVAVRGTSGRPCGVSDGREPRCGRTVRRVLRAGAECGRHSRARRLWPRTDGRNGGGARPLRCLAATRDRGRSGTTFERAGHRRRASPPNRTRSVGRSPSLRHGAVRVPVSIARARPRIDSARQPLPSTGSPDRAPFPASRRAGIRSRNRGRRPPAPEDRPLRLRTPSPAPTPPLESGLPSPGLGAGRAAGSSAPRGSAAPGGRPSGSAPTLGGGRGRGGDN